MVGEPPRWPQPQLPGYYNPPPGYNDAAASYYDGKHTPRRQEVAVAFVAAHQHTQHAQHQSAPPPVNGVSNEVLPTGAQYPTHATASSWR